MTGKTFIDTNIAVYAVDESPAQQRKHAIALTALTDNPSELAVSTQVLQEFYVVVTRKLVVPLDEKRAAAAVHGLAELAVVGTDTPLVLAAIETSRDTGLALWDALIVEAARQAGCARVLTEDLSHGQVIRGVRAENPFLNSGRV